jgi:hypothetical protein
MAKDIGDPTVGAALQALFRLQGRVKIGMEEFVIPTVQVADLSVSAAPALAAGAAAQLSVVGVAAQRTTWRFEIPGSMFAQVLAFNIFMLAGTRFNVAFTAAGPGHAGIAGKALTDGRLTQRGLEPAGVMTGGATAAAPIGAQWRTELAANEERRFEPKHWIVGSGLEAQFGFIEFQAGTANIGGTLSIEWAEYPNV